MYDDVTCDSYYHIYMPYRSLLFIEIGLCCHEMQVTIKSCHVIIIYDDVTCVASTDDMKCHEQS